MYNRMIARLFLNSALIFIIAACAKVSLPSGGIRDRIPPVVIKSVPLNGARNFKGKKLEIEFNEYLTLDNINEKFMVSPPMKRKPRVFLKGKNIEVEFNEKLKDSTTYTFYFQDAIKDLNEGNILQNYKFVFSTGPVIDSLSVTGNIYNAFNLEVPEKSEVLMYRELADSAVVKHLPQYISKVDQNGYFRIDNVRPGTYRLYGLKDGDNSKNYNLPDEEFAFTDSTVVVTSERNYIPPPVIKKDTVIVKKAVTKAPQPAKKGVYKNAAGTKDTTNVKKRAAKIIEPPLLFGEHRLYQFAAQKKAHYLTSSKRDLKYLFTYILSLPPDTMKFDFSIIGADSKTYFTEPNRNRDTLKVWLTDSALYSQALIKSIVKYPFTDTLGKTGYKQDTIPMRFLQPHAPRLVKVKRTSFTIENNIQSGFLKPGQTIYFKSRTPFRQPDTSRIKLYELVQASRRKMPYSLIRDSTTLCRYYLKTKLEEKKKYLLVADSASFANIYNEHSDSLGIKFSIKDPESYSKLTLDIKNYVGDRIIQLLDKSEKLIAQTYMKKDGKIIFPLLDPGVYRLRVIYDLNGDGKWTTGDFTTHKQPEPVSYFPGPDSKYTPELELKTGWDLDQEWDISVKHFKDPKLLERTKGK
jgi:hypothetical protein